VVDLAEGQTVDERAAAKYQHHYALKIRRRAQQKFGSLEGYAEACGVPADRLVKVMRGEAIMRIEDLVRAERVLGYIITSPAR